MAALENKDSIIVAIELGTSRISGIAGKKKDGGIQIIAYAEEPTNASCIKRGQVYNIEKTTQGIKSVIAKLESTLRQSISQVYVGIGGQSVRSIKNKVQKNLVTETYITAEHIDEMRDESQRVPADYELLDNFPQSCSVDGRPAPDDPVGIVGTKIENEYLNVIARRTLRNNIETCFSNTDVKVKEMRLAAYDLAENVLTDQEKRAGSVLVDLGAGTTTVVVYKNNILRHLVTLPIGSANITQDLTSWQIDEAEAEVLKLQYGNAIEEEKEETEEASAPQTYTTTYGKVIKLSDIQATIDARMVEIIANIHQQIINSGYGNQLLGGVVLTGGGAAMKNIVKAFAERLKMEKVRVADRLNFSVIKNSTVTNFTADNVRSTSIIALLEGGNENCVGEKKSAQPSMFEQHDKEQEIALRKQEEQRAAEAEAAALQKLEEFKNQTRHYITRLDQKYQDVCEDGDKKSIRKSAAAFVEEAKNLLGHEFVKVIAQLETKEKNRQTIREARDLEIKLNEAIEKLQNEVTDAENKNSVWSKFKSSLENLVNGND